MKLLILSLLPLAAELVVARPAPQEESAALTRRLSPLPDPQEHPDEEDPAKSTEDPGSWQFSEPPGFDYSQDLTVNFPTDATGRFLGLDEDQVADLRSFFTDDKGFNVAIRPDLKLPDGDAYDTAFLDEGDSDVTDDSDHTDPSVEEDDSTPPGDKGTEKTEVKTYLPPFIPGTPTFDPKFTEFFDVNGLPKVAFDPNKNYALKIDVPIPAASAEPKGDYSDFLVTSSLSQ